MFKTQWKSLSDKVSVLQVREKWILFAGVLLSIAWLCITYWVWPLLDEIEAAKRTIQAQSIQVGSTQKQIGLYEGALGKDPNTAVNNSIEQTELQIAKIDTLLAQLTVNFISPHKMREVLNELLKGENNIKVTEFTALAAEKVNIEGVPANADITIYQHGIRLTVLGNYFDLQQYMKRVEELPWQFNWKVFDYTVEAHPNAKLEIEITTISTNERFIAI